MTNLKKLRVSKGLRQIELARLAGVSKFSVHQSERLGVQTLRLARKYAKALKCKPIRILG